MQTSPSTTAFRVCAFAYHFTGKERDLESGNDYFGARYYASSIGRFMSPDWSKTPEGVPYADLTNPQSLNLYSYVKNNPLSKVDPDGHCCDFFDQAVGLVVTTGNFFNPLTRIATGVVVFQTTMQVNEANNGLGGPYLPNLPQSGAGAPYLAVLSPDVGYRAMRDPSFLRQNRVIWTGPNGLKARKIGHFAVD